MAGSNDDGNLFSDWPLHTKKYNYVVGSNDNGSIFFRKKGHADVYKWNVNVPFDMENCSIVKKGNECRLTTHVVPGMKNTVWAVESNFPDYISNTIPRSGPSMSIHPLIKQT